MTAPYRDPDWPNRNDPPPEMGGQRFLRMMMVRWWRAECSTVPFEDLGPDMLRHVFLRVRDVLRGEVPRSKCGPGDTAIWGGRFRGNELVKELTNLIDEKQPRRPLPRPTSGPRLHGVRQISLWKEIVPQEIDADWIRSGAHSRTTALGHDTGFAVAYVHATADWIEQDEVVWDVLKRLRVEIRDDARNMIVTPSLSVYDLIMEPFPARLYFMVNGCFTVRVSPVSIEHGERLYLRLRSRFHLEIHLEGARNREVC